MCLSDTQRGLSTTSSYGDAHDNGRIRGRKRDLCSLRVLNLTFGKDPSHSRSEYNHAFYAEQITLITAWRFSTVTALRPRSSAGMTSFGSVTFSP